MKHGKCLWIISGIAAISLCSMIFVSAADGVSQTVDAYSEYMAYVQDFIVDSKDSPFTPEAILSATSYEIINIGELHKKWYSDEVDYLVYDIEWNTGRNSYYIFDCADGCVTESANCKSPFLKYLGLDGMNAENISLMYEGGFDYYAIITDSATGEVHAEHCKTGETIYNLEQYDDPNSGTVETEPAEMQIGETSEIVMTEKQIRKIREKQQLEQYSITAIDPVKGYIEDVPMNVQTTSFPCIPTSLLNVIQYWDERDYPNLISTISAAKDDIKAALDAEGGHTKNASIPGAVSSYADDKGYYGNAVNMSNPDFYDLKYEIHYKYPCLVGFPAGVFHSTLGHMTTGVGYEVLSGIEYVYVYDNYSDDIKEEPVRRKFSECDFICGIEILDLN